MAFDIDENLVMKIRKGTTGEFVIEELPADFDGLSARFTVKKEPSASDVNAPVNIVSTVSGNHSVTFTITQNDSDALIVPSGEETSSYVWGVLVYNAAGTTAINIIPERFKEMPECIVYPEIGGDD